MPTEIEIIAFLIPNRIETWINCKKMQALKRMKKKIYDFHSENVIYIKKKKNVVEIENI